MPMYGNREFPEGGIFSLSPLAAPKESSALFLIPFLLSFFSHLPLTLCSIRREGEMPQGRLSYRLMIQKKNIYLS